MTDYDAILRDVNETDYGVEELKDILRMIIGYNKDLTKKLEKEKKKVWHYQKLIFPLEDCLAAYMEAFQEQAKKAQSIEEALSCLRIFVSKTVDCLNNTEILVQDFQQSAQRHMERFRVLPNSIRCARLVRTRAREPIENYENSQRKSSGKTTQHLSSDNENESPCKRLRSTSSTHSHGENFNRRRYRKKMNRLRHVSHRNSGTCDEVSSVSNHENSEAVNRIDGEHLNESIADECLNLNDEEAYDDSNHQITVESSSMLGLSNNIESNETETMSLSQEDNNIVSLRSPRHKQFQSSTSLSHHHSTNSARDMEFSKSLHHDLSGVSATITSSHWHSERTPNEGNDPSLNNSLSSEDDEYSTADEDSQSLSKTCDTESELPSQEMFTKQPTRKHRSRRKRESAGLASSHRRKARTSVKGCDSSVNVSFSSEDGVHHNTQQGDQLYVVLHDILKESSANFNSQSNLENFEDDSICLESTLDQAEMHIDVSQSEAEIKNFVKGNDICGEASIDLDFAVVQETREKRSKSLSGSDVANCDVITQVGTPEEDSQSNKELENSVKVSNISKNDSSPHTRSVSEQEELSKINSIISSSSKNLTYDEAPSKVHDEANQFFETVEDSVVLDGPSLELNLSRLDVAKKAKSRSGPEGENISKDVLVKIHDHTNHSNKVGTSNKDSYVYGDDVTGQKIQKSFEDSNVSAHDITGEKQSEVQIPVDEKVELRERKNATDYATSQAEVLGEVNKSEEEVHNSVEDSNICEDVVSEQRVDDLIPIVKKSRPRGRPPKEKRKLRGRNMSSVNQKTKKSLSQEAVYSSTVLDLEDESGDNVAKLDHFVDGDDFDKHIGKEDSSEKVPYSVGSIKLGTSKRKLKERKGFTHAMHPVKDSLLHSHSSSLGIRESEIKEAELNNEASNPKTVDSVEQNESRNSTEERADSVVGLKPVTRIVGSRKSLSLAIESNAAKKSQSASYLGVVESTENKTQQDTSEAILFDNPVCCTKEDTNANSVDGVSLGPGIKKRNLRSKRGKADANNSKSKSKSFDSPKLGSSLTKKGECRDYTKIKHSASQLNNYAKTECDIENLYEKDSNSSDLLESSKPTSRNRHKGRTDAEHSDLRSKPLDCLEVKNIQGQAEEQCAIDEAAKQKENNEMNENLDSVDLLKPSSRKSNLREEPSGIELLPSVKLLNMDYEDSCESKTNHDLIHDHEPAARKPNEQDRPYDPEEDIVAIDDNFSVQDDQFSASALNSSPQSPFAANSEKTEVEDGEILSEEESALMTSVEDSCDGMDTDVYLAVDEANCTETNAEDKDELEGDTR